MPSRNDQTPRPPTTEQRIAQLIEKAEKTAHDGHDGHGCDDRAGYAGIAQVYATLALQAELRLARVQQAEALDRIIGKLGAIDAQLQRIDSRIKR